MDFGVVSDSSSELSESVRLQSDKPPEIVRVGPTSVGQASRNCPSRSDFSRTSLPKIQETVRLKSDLLRKPFAIPTPESMKSPYLFKTW